MTRMVALSPVLAVLALLLCCGRLLPVSDAAVCPSSSPSESNPVGCLLTSFTSAVAAPNTASLDTFAVPSTLLVGSITTNAVAVHFLNGTFLKNLSGTADFPVQLPEQAAIDNNGFVFLLNTNLDYDAYSSNYTGYILIFTPYPDYDYFSVIIAVATVNAALAIVAQGEYLYVTTDSMQLGGAQDILQLVRDQRCDRCRRHSRAAQLRLRRGDQPRLPASCPLSIPQTCCSRSIRQPTAPRR